jgi:hypothetical protein
MPNKLPIGYKVCQDSDGDWVLIGPEDVIIFSVPGEPVLLGANNKEAAIIEAAQYLRRV